jgi:eukaryotic-like serine/threonine-protein kinase
MTSSDTTGGVSRVIAGRYRLGPRRGSGVDAARFDAFDAQLQRVVVLRMIHPDLTALESLRKRFGPTMDATAAVHHPNIAAVLDWGLDEWNEREMFFVVYEQLGGGSLRELLDRGRRLTGSQSLVVGLDACKGLDALHRAGLLHGDVRTSTLVFGQDRRLRLVDAGLGHLLSGVLWADPASITQDRAMYAAPEQARGQLPTAKSDVYALCLSLLESVSGTVPFVGDSAVSTLANRVDKLLPVSADLGPLAAVLGHAGRPDPADRSTAAQFGRGLVEAAAKMPRPAPIPVLSPAVPPPSALTGSVDPTGPLQRVAPAGVPSPDTAGTVPPPPPAGSPPSPPEGDPASESPPIAATALSASAPVPGGPPSTAETASTSAPDEPDAPSATTGGPSPPAPPPPPGPTPAPPPPGPPPTSPSAPAPPAGPGPGSEPTTALPEPSAAPTTAMPEPSAAPTTAMPEPSAAPTTAMPAPSAAPTAVMPRPPSVYDHAASSGEVTVMRHRRKRWPWVVLAIVVLALAAGVAGYLLTRPGDTLAIQPVPALAGLTQAEVAARIAAEPWNTTVVEEYSDDVAVGIVLRTDPPAFAPLASDELLTLVASKGPEPRPLPELAGVTIEQAQSLLAAQQLVMVQGDPVYDENVPAGSVVSWVVPTQPGLVAGGGVLPGTEVVVVPSQGPQPRIVPNVIGQTLDQARAALEPIGLVVAQAPDEFSNDVLSGGIVRTDPAAGTEVPRGTTVTIVVSKGPDLVSFPAFPSLDLPTVQQVLSEAGLTIASVTGNSAGALTQASIDGDVVQAGEQFLRGTGVDLIFL